jgi:pyrimidine operon attenuation protein/uracil phosphoribosyltransferase
MSHPTTVLLDARQLHQALDGLAADLLEAWRREPLLVLVGVHRRGVPLAEALALRLTQAGMKIELGRIDITQYRDDLAQFKRLPRILGSQIECEIDDRVVILCDEVVHTGRTIRAALDELLDFGRPRCVEVAAVVERPQRQLPIEVRHAAQRVQVASSQRISVHFSATDGRDEVLIETITPAP